MSLFLEETAIKNRLKEIASKIYPSDSNPNCGMPNWILAMDLEAVLKDVKEMAKKDADAQEAFYSDPRGG
jgi:hypothetical protein